MAGQTLTQAGAPVRVAVLQGNIVQDEKWDPALRDAIIGRYIGMTREAIARGATFILWPESSPPVLLRGRPAARRGHSPAGARTPA